MMVMEVYCKGSGVKELNTDGDGYDNGGEILHGNEIVER